MDVLTHKFRWHSRPAREGGSGKSRIEEPGFWTPVRIARDEFARERFGLITYEPHHDIRES